MCFGSWVYYGLAIQPISLLQVFFFASFFQMFVWFFSLIATWYCDCYLRTARSWPISPQHARKQIVLAAAALLLPFVSFIPFVFDTELFN